MITPRLQKFFDNYAASHQTPGNQITHYFGITIIVMSLLGLLGNFTFQSNLVLFTSSYFRLDPGTCLILLTLPFYLYLDWKIAPPFALILFGLYFLGRAVPTPINCALFVLGWVLQGIGHAVFEKRSPAFFQNLLHLLIGPLWIFSKTVRYWKPPLK